MPKSTDKATARVRRAFTGESQQAALAGIPRDGSIGLDTCLSAQRRLRALFALGLLNRGYGPTAAPAASWGLHTLTAYSITVSPRFERLVLITDVPHNVAPYLLPRTDGVVSLPGLRLVELRGNNSYVTHHLPTGAELIITSDWNGRWTGPSRPAPHREFLQADTPLSERETQQLAAVPELSPESERLLAGLAVRMSLRNGNEWAIGNWFSDPLHRPGWLESSGVDRYEKQLAGTSDHWELSWTGFPHREDVAASLTDPVAGVHGAVVHKTGDEVEIRLGRAVLALRGQSSPSRSGAQVGVRR